MLRFAARSECATSELQYLRCPLPRPSPAQSFGRSAHAARLSATVIACSSPCLQHPPSRTNMHRFIIGHYWDAACPHRLDMPNPNLLTILFHPSPLVKVGPIYIYDLWPQPAPSLYKDIDFRSNWPETACYLPIKLTGPIVRMVDPSQAMSWSFWKQSHAIAAGQTVIHVFSCWRISVALDRGEGGDLDDS